VSARARKSQSWRTVGLDVWRLRVYAPYVRVDDVQMIDGGVECLCWGSDGRQLMLLQALISVRISFSYGASQPRP
jgi:hypothetical protein